MRVEQLLGGERVWVAVAMMGLTALGAGCRGKQPAMRTGFSEPMTEGGQMDAAALSAKKVGGAAQTIVGACAKQPYENASRGLIVAETGLREDVFDLRDRLSYQAVPFGLGEAQRLEALLRMESRGATRTASATDCIGKFADHLQTLTDPLVEAEAVQKQLDVSAFDNASKEAEREAEQEEKAIATPSASSR
ncbi:MAG: hypothetical protein ABI072_10750 [Edaphobacter sp.]